MATASTVMSRTDKMENNMENLGIKGLGLGGTTRAADGANLMTTPSEASPASSRPDSSATSGTVEPGGAIGSFNIPQEAVGVLETVINMNKALEQQIDALRIRLNVEAKHHETEKQSLLTQRDVEIGKKEEEIGGLKDNLAEKDSKISGLVKKSDEKDSQLNQKAKDIDDLKSLVKQTEEYAESLQKKVGKLRSDKHRLESDTVYKEQNEEIRRLKHELVSMKDKINSLEKELSRAKHIMEQQNTKVKTLESEKSAIHEKFREELDKASRAMRSEVERMREIMKIQYEEMRNLREQNREISGDVRVIKELLLQNTITPELDAKMPNKDRLDVNNFKSPPLTRSPNMGMRTVRTPRSQQPTSMRSSMPIIDSSRGSNGFPAIPKKDDGRWIPSGVSRPSPALKTTNRLGKK